MRGGELTTVGELNHANVGQIASTEEAALVLLDKAESALEAVTRPEEAVAADEFGAGLEQALRLQFRNSKRGFKALTRASLFRLLAEAKGGRLLQLVEPAQGSKGLGLSAAMQKAGIEPTRGYRWKGLAEVPEFETKVRDLAAACLASENDPTPQELTHALVEERLVVPWRQECREKERERWNGCHPGKLRRERLLLHLEHVWCRGQIGEAVFTDAFATTALTPDHLLLVRAPPLLTAAPVFPEGEAFGITDLPFLIGALNKLAGAGNEAVDVDVRYESGRLVLEEALGVLRLPGVPPKVIGTYLKPEVVKNVVVKAPKEEGGAPVTRHLVDAVCGAFSLYGKQARVELVVGPRGGSVRIADFEMPYSDLKADESYRVMLDKHFVDVLGTVTEFAEARLYLGGPDGFVLVADGGYRYLLSPRDSAAIAVKNGRV